MTPKELREKRAGLHSQMSALVDKARTEKRQMSAEEDEQFERIDADMKKLDGDIERAERYEARTAQMNALQPIVQDNINAATQVDAGRKQAYDQAFNRYLKLGLGAMSGEEQAVLRGGYQNDGPQAALTPSTGVGGGYIVPQGFEDKLTEAMKWYGGMDQFSTTITTDTGNPIPFPTSNDTTNTGEIVGPNVQVTQAIPTFGQLLFNAYKFSSKLVLVPIELLQDSAFDLDSWIPKQLGVRLARIQNNKFTVGTGSSEPTGVVTAAAAAGNIITDATGNTTTVTANNFLDLEGAVDKAYRPGAKYMMNDKTLTAVKKLQDSNGRSLWLPGLAASLQGGYPNTINGYEYVINNDMPVPGASNYIMAFGDFTSFVIRRVKGYTVLRLTERYADYGQVGFLCFERADSNLVDAGTHPIALLQNSAT